MVTFSDFTGAGLLAGFAELGVNVPGEISVFATGEQPFTRMLRPALTTLSPPFEQIAEVATTTLLQMIEGGPGASAALMPKVSMRDSVREIVK